MSVLNDALPGVSTLIPLSQITLKSKVKTLKDGFISQETSEITTYAHAQPLSNSRLLKNTDLSLLSAEIVYCFWITKNLAEVLNFLQNTETAIMYKDRVYNVFSKEDWSANGWIKVIATIQGDANV